MLRMGVGGMSRKLFCDVVIKYRKLVDVKDVLVDRYANVKYDVYILSLR